jgi:hypothetical protein
MVICDLKNKSNHCELLGLAVPFEPYFIFVNKNKVGFPCFWLFVTCVLAVNILAMVGE